MIPVSLTKDFTMINIWKVSKLCPVFNRILTYHLQLLTTNSKTSLLYVFFLRNGTKYILRTDIMYEKCEGDKLTEEQEKALQLIQEAERLEVKL